MRSVSFLRCLRRSSVASVCAVLTLSAVAVQPALAHQGAEGIVKERMDMMKQMRDAMKVLRPLMDADVVDQGKALPPAQTIADLSAKIVKHFPKGSLGGDSDALPDIWENWDDFTDDAAASTKDAKDLVSAIQGGDGHKAMRAYAHVAHACKECHDDFKERD